ncbi:hypothetical protein KAFR_0F00820 [Kazachstania africana CBS 2517]|uniref:Mitochondrial import inner membrane translocase subunit TIM23 n=1 Tax=Kazachstania africana (strain ATCC 22294 / BCRC 22015 / CBS 2517 / CECT 1963 / NBRC 1671 / NRRL Y-8276) TaxID=1071382 RepID=H2AWC9_KAZAF|nr:hypothetical protein KAFR_0F00820 [Kazachstania africana CBS 2517]CCF58679.1 hypothetical protein KAFR_0F00820 [Kazachstania africana CBS 2517]
MSFNNQGQDKIDTSRLTNVASILTTPAGSIFDSRKLHPLAGLDKGVEYMDLEEEQLSTMEGSQGLLPSRGWTDDLCYGTGTVYLLGLGIGGVSGLFHGLQNLPPNSPGKLKLNTVLNSITKRGPFLGNSAGILALSYNIINSSIDSIRGKHNTMNSVAAGALTGAIFKSSKGLKPMAYASGLMAGTAAIWCGFKKSVLE